MTRDERDDDLKCDDAACFIPTDRRRFLRDTALRAAAALVAVGATRATALAMPIEIVTGRRGAPKVVSFDIPKTDGVKIDKENEVILVKWANAVYAFDLSCPHQNTALRWDDVHPAFVCPKHHSRFEPSGQYIPGSGRATRSMDRFAIARAGDDVRVDLDKLYREDENAHEWADAVIKLA